MPDTAAAAAAAARVDEIGPAEPPALATALQRRHAVRRGIRIAARAGATCPTHVILNGRAHAIDEHPLVLGLGDGAGSPPGARRPQAAFRGRTARCCARDGVAIVRDHSRHGTFVNGERVDGEAVLGAGDRLRLGTPGVVLDLVAVA